MLLPKLKMLKVVEPNKIIVPNLQLQERKRKVNNFMMSWLKLSSTKRTKLISLHWEIRERTKTKTSMKQEINIINTSSHIQNIKEPKLKESQFSNADPKQSNRTQIQDSYRWKTLKMSITFSNHSILNWETWKMSTSVECNFLFYFRKK